MNGRAIAGLVLVATLFGAGAANADEVRLKDGSKIVGTIVGFENDSFRVETAYGFALVQKDKVADINITAPKKDPEPTTKAEAPAPPKKGIDSKAKSAAPDARENSANAPSVSPTVAGESSSSAHPSPESDAPAPGRAGARKNMATASAKGDPATPSAKSDSIPPSVVAGPSAVASSPSAAGVSSPATPEPRVIRDEVRGNLYINLTYGFQMYKPPSWDLIPAARKALPDAVAALGTYDQTTLLVIGLEKAKDSLDSHAAATGKALSGIYENYRLISNRHVTIAGFPAVEQRSRGTADGRDWSVILLTILKGNDAYTLLGMTWADSDLIQVQENVISKTVNSLAFAAP